MKIGIVMPTVNNWQKFTRPMIDSIKSKHDLYFVIVDNASTDNTEVEAMKFVNDSFHYKKNTENVGCSIAWNYGIRDCFINRECTYVAVFNNDVLLHPNAIDNLIDRFEKKDKDIVMVTCINVKGDCKDIPSNIFTLNDMDWGKTEEGEHPDFSGFMMSKECWDKVGQFDEAFSEIGGAYFEDSDYHRRIKLAGLKAINCPQALFYHYGSGSKMEGKFTIPPNLRFESNRDYFCAKWGGLPENDGALGDRLWTHPFNDETKDYRWALRNESKDKQEEIIAKYKKV
jgi:GT2 family glycosyltransferase